MSEADVVQMIYRLTTEQHMSTIKIADYLNALGLPTKYTIDGRKIAKGKRKENTSGQWLPGRIRNMLVQTTYKGIHGYGKRSKKEREIIEREVPAIVPENIWEQAQMVLKDNQLECIRCAKHKYLLRSLVKCSLCGLNFSGTRFKGSKGQPTPYYVCNGKTTYRGKYMGKCPAKNVSADWLDEKVWDDCVDFINNPGKLLDGLSPEESSNNVSTEHELLLIASSLSQKDSEKQSILVLYRKQLITNKDVEDQLSKIINEKTTLEAQQKELKNALNATTDEVNRKKDVIMILDDLKQKISGEVTWEIKRDIIKQLVRNVTVYTTHSEDRDDPIVKLSVKFVFSQDVPRTDKRAWNNLDEIVVHRTINQGTEITIGNTPSERIRWARMQKGWMIKTLAAMAGITPTSLSHIENKFGASIEITPLRKLSAALEQPVWFLGCFDSMPEDTFFQRLKKARCYHGHTKVEMAKRIVVNKRIIFNWKQKEPGQVTKEKVELYWEIL